MHFRRNNLQELLLLQIVVRRDPLLNPFEFVDAFSVQFEGRSALRSSVITFSKCLEKRGKVEFVEQVHLVLLTVSFPTSSPEVHSLLRGGNVLCWADLAGLRTDRSELFVCRVR